MVNMNPAEQLYGYDRHAWDILPADAPKARKVSEQMMVHGACGLMTV